MIPILGSLSLSAAFIASLIPILSLCGLRFSSTKHLYAISFTAIIGIFLLLSISLLSLIYLYAISDFSLLLVANNSHTMIPLFYKISATWGNHEGSLLLFMWMLSGLSITIIKWRAQDGFKLACLFFQSIIIFCFLFFIIQTSNPFAKIFPAPLEGKGFNPILQDVALAVHPPILYLGYSLTSLLFSSACAQLLIWEENFITLIKKISLISWGLIGCGVSLGSWWAYRELGWGGFWFWDPVENISLQPWLMITTIIHGIFIYRRKPTYLRYLLSFCILSFILCVFASFITRSGIITSVHAFANDPQRGIFIFAIMSILLLMVLILFYVSKNLNQTNENNAYSKLEFSFLWNNILLVVATSTILIATAAPVIYDHLYHKSISIGEGYFVKSFIPVMLCFAAMASFYHYLKSKNYIIASLTSMVVAGILYPHFKLVPLCAIIIGVFLVCSILIDFRIRIQNSSILNLSRSYYRMFFAHLGFGLLIIFISFASCKELQLEQQLMVKEHMKFMDFDIELQKLSMDKQQNYIGIKAQLYIEKNHNEFGTMEPEMRIYPIEKLQTTETAISSNLLFDLYANFTIIDKETINLKLHYKPCMMLMWLSVLIMALVPVAFMQCH